MLKLYRRDSEGTLHYHEAWASEDTVVEHWGPVGTEGESRMHRHDPTEDETQAIERVLAAARQDGFQEVAPEDHHVLLIEYAVDDHGSEGDLERRYALQDRCDETLGWTGLGHCDGGSIGSGTMEVCCYVVDFEIAKQVIEEDLANTEFGDFLRIYDQDAD